MSVHSRIDEAGEKLSCALEAKLAEWELKLAQVAAMKSGPPELGARVEKLENMMGNVENLIEKLE